MSESYDAIIIGAGIIGASIGFELTRKGYRTLNVDKLPAAGYGPTAASCAIIRVHYSTFDGCAMAWEGWHYWDDWAGYVGDHDERGLAAYRNIGCVVFKTERNHHLRPVTEHLDAVGVPWEDWDLDELSRRMPRFDAHGFWPVRRIDDPDFGKDSGDMVAGAVFTPDSGYVSDPQLATHNIQRAAESVGAKFRFNSEVTEIRRASGRVDGVTLADGTRIDAPNVVNVAGPHSDIINCMAGVEKGMNIRTKALRQEVAHVPCPEGMTYDYVVSDGDVGCYSRPEVGNQILIGSEDPDCDPREWVDPDDYDRNLTDQAKAQVYREAQRIPTLGIPNSLKGVVDLYDVSDDWIPLYDGSDLPGFFMAIGTSGNQFKNGPVAGAMMAEIIDRCHQGHEHDAEPVQFALKHCGITVNTGFYSRRRTVNPDSSFSVIG